MWIGRFWRGWGWAGRSSRLGGSDRGVAEEKNCWTGGRERRFESCTAGSLVHAFMGAKYC